MSNLHPLANTSRYDLELFIGKLLRFGVIISCIVTVFGGCVYLFQQNGVMPNYRPVPMGEPFEGVAHDLRSLSTILPRVLAFDGAAIIQLGVCILLSTPVLRVFVSMIGFALEKNRMYVVISSLVLIIILLNALLGIHE